MVLAGYMYLCNGTPMRASLHQKEKSVPFFRDALKSTNITAMHTNHTKKSINLGHILLYHKKSILKVDTPLLKISYTYAGFYVSVLSTEYCIR